MRKDKTRHLKVFNISRYLFIAIYFCSTFLFSFLANGQTTYTGIATGNWSSAGTWDANGIPPTTLSNNDVIIINCGICTITNNTGGTIVIDGSLTIGANATLDMEAQDLTIGLNANTAILTIDQDGTLVDVNDLKAKRDVTPDGDVGNGPFINNSGTITAVNMPNIGQNMGGGKLTNTSTGVIIVTAGNLHVDGTIDNAGTINVTGNIFLHGAVVTGGGALNVTGEIKMQTGAGAGGATQGGPVSVISQAFGDGAGCSGADATAPLYEVPGGTGGGPNGDDTYTYQELLDEFGTSNGTDFTVDANNVSSCGEAPLCDSATATAGSDATVCFNTSHTLAATATNGTILWTTSGDGGFGATATTEDAVYTPGATDNGTDVTLTMTVTGTCNAVSDDIILTVDAEAVSDVAAATDNVCYDATYTLAATATNGTILWTTSGDGGFGATATTEDAVYTPGATDNGTDVTLTMTVTGTCNTVSDDIILTVDAEAVSDVAAATDNVCYDATYTLAATATNGTILWTTSGDGGFGATATTEDAVYTPGPGDKGTDVTLTMTVTGTCNAVSDDIILTVDAEAVSDVVAATDNVCYDATYTLAATATNGTILWTTSGDGGFGATATTEDAVYTPGATDNGTDVTLTMTVTGTCNAVSDDIILTVDAEAVSDVAAATDNVCYDATYTLAATATNGTILWTTSGDGGFGATATTEDAVYTPGATDNGTDVTLTMTVTGTCNTVSDDIILTVDAEAVSDVAAATDNVCYDATYTLAATATNGTILWTTSGDGGFGATATTEDAVYTPGPGDKGTDVTLTMTVTGTCNAVSDDIILTVDAEAVSDVVAATDNVCYDATYTLAATATNGTILWTTSGDGGFGATATTEDAVYTPGATDNGTDVTLTMTVTGTCNTVSDDIILTVDAEAVSDVAAATDNVCYDATYTLAATATNGTILWTTSGDGGFGTTATTEDAVYTPGPGDNGTDVTLTMTVTGTCNEVSDEMILTVDQEAIAMAGADAVACSTYQLEGTATNGTISWSSDGDGSFSNVALEDPTYTFGSGDIAAGSVTLTITVSGNCSTTSEDVVLTVEPETSAVAGTDVTACGNYQLEATATNGTILWTTDGDGTFDNATLEDPAYILGIGDISSGTVTLTITVTGNCSAVSDDVVLTEAINPVISNCPADIVMKISSTGCGEAATWTAPTATDNCAVDSFTSTHNSGDIFPVGTTIVSYTATDPAGNYTSCTFNITIVDDIAPKIQQCSPAITHSDFDVVSKTAIATWEEPIVQDNCDILEFTSNHESGTRFPEGTTVVTYTATDVSGNSSSCSFDVNIEINEPPVIEPFAASLQSGEEIRICLQASDPEGDGMRLESVNYNSSNGTIRDIDNEGLCFSYQADLFFEGDDEFTVTICDINNPELCSEGLVTISVFIEDEVIVSQVITPNGDGINDVWEIENIESHPDNSVIIQDRWGSSIYKADGYDNQNVVWVPENLPVGTYFYTIQLGNGQPSIAGFLELVF